MMHRFDTRGSNKASLLCHKTDVTCHVQSAVCPFCCMHFLPRLPFPWATALSTPAGLTPLPPCNGSASYWTRSAPVKRTWHKLVIRSTLGVPYISTMLWNLLCQPSFSSLLFCFAPWHHVYHTMTLEWLLSLLWSDQLCCLWTTGMLPTGQ